MLLPSIPTISLPILIIHLLTPSQTTAQNFPFESLQLTEVESITNPFLHFGNNSQPTNNDSPRCKTTPTDADWPTNTEWSSLNATLDGALLKPRPLALPCYNEGSSYDGARCDTLRRGWGDMALHANHPISVCSQWATGDACVPTSQSDSTCSQGGYPVYVVNATTAKHVQAAVNFARNRNIRVVIKNSGHDYNGRNLGAHSLSIWVHNLKGTTFHARYTTPTYTGRAIAVAGGTNAADVYPIRTAYNTTIQLPGGATVGVAGGYAQGGGHSSYSSIYGLTADNVLSVTAVTADGRLVTANETANTDLFWAFRGGGGGNFGIVTSMIIAAFPQTPSTSTSITFSTVPRIGQSPTLSTAAFWQGVNAYWEHCIAICDAGGLGYNFIRHTTSGNVKGLTFTTSISLPFYSSAETRAFVQPLLDKLRGFGITSASSLSGFEVLQTQQGDDDDDDDDEEREAGTAALGDTIHDVLIASRLFTRPNFATASSLAEMNAAIRTFVEDGGYDFHGQNYNPSEDTAAYDTDNAVHPAFRTSLMHAQGYEPRQHWDGTGPQVPVAEQATRHDRLQAYMQAWRDITPGSGSYANEGDAQSKDWKDGFYGANYERLVGVKKAVDPEGVFWVLGGVGSDEWEVRGSGGGRSGLFTQDGPLCRVE